MVAFTALLAVFTTLAITSSQVAANPSEAINQLLARQSTFDPSMIPEQCRSECGPLADAITGGNCLDLDCLCGSRISGAMSSCLRCGVGAIGADTAQSYYDSYSSACKSAGKSVPSFSAASSGGGSSSGGSADNSSSNNGSSGSSGNGASRTHIAGVGLAGALSVGFILAV